jgi:hypothetical protein
MSAFATGSIFVGKIFASISLLGICKAIYSGRISYTVRKKQEYLKQHITAQINNQN